VQDLASLTRDWLRRVWSQRSRAEWAVAWYLPLMTAAAAMVVALASSVPVWLMQAHVDPAERAIPVGRHLLRILLDAPWRGAFLGLGLVLLDRTAGRWRRSLRWPGLGALFSCLLASHVPSPTEWRYLLDDIQAGGVGRLLGVPTSWREGLWTLQGIAWASVWLWWVARSVPGPGRPHRALARAGAEAGVVIALANAVLLVPEWLVWSPPPDLSWRQVWGSSAFGVVAAALKGGLNGLMIAIALWAGRPKAEPTDPTPQ